MATEKPLMLVGIDSSTQSFYALEWALDHFFVPFSSNSPFRLGIVNAKASPASVAGLAGPAAAEVLLLIDADLKRDAARILERARELCASKSVKDVMVEVMEGDPRNVLCEVVEKNHAAMLVVGSHGYGAIKRAVLGSVSDYCAHRAHCTVMIVKQPKWKH